MIIILHYNHLQIYKWSIILQDIIITFYFHKGHVEIIVITSTQCIIKGSCKFIWNSYFVKTVGILKYPIKSNEEHTDPKLKLTIIHWNKKKISIVFFKILQIYLIIYNIIEMTKVLGVFNLKLI